MKKIGYALAVTAALGAVVAGMPVAASAQETGLLERPAIEDVQEPDIQTYTNNVDTGFHFSLTSKGATAATGFRRKDNNSSLYVKVTKKTGSTCRVFADGAKNDSGLGKRDCTQRVSKAYGTGEYELYNTVNENKLGYARLSAWAESGAGVLSGVWSPDCVGHFKAFGA